MKKQPSYNYGRWWCLAAMVVAWDFRARASLPPAVGNDEFQCDELSPAFSIPLLDLNASNATSYLTVDPTKSDLSSQPLPLVLMAINTLDPWSNVMVTTNESLDQFLTETPTLSDGSTDGPDAHFAFGDYSGDAGRLLDFKARLEGRMRSLGLSDETQTAWSRKLHWLSGAPDSWGKAGDVLSS